MENLEFNISIDAPREKVWAALWGKKEYPEWTSAFAPGSTIETNWEQGSKVLFLDGQGFGLSSVIEKKRINEYMSFQHLRSVKNGVEVMDDPEDKKWTGSRETYRLEESGGKTTLFVMLETKGMDEKVLGEFKVMWPKALDKLKTIAER